jgi:hypothetical protein
MLNSSRISLPARTMILLAGWSIATAFAQNARTVAQGTFPSVVLLQMTDREGNPGSLGSGFFVRPDVVATNLHVIEGMSGGYAKLVGQKGSFNVNGTVAIDAEHDLALLAVQGTNAPSLRISSPDRKPEIGEEIFVAGNPEGLEGTFSSGIVSGVRQIQSGVLIQITAPISPGSSGGPVLNANGDVVGVVVSYYKDGQNLNFAIPSSDLSKLLLNATASPKPLVPTPNPERRSSRPNDIGGRLTEGVTAEKLKWDSINPDAVFSFSLVNHLRVLVDNVVCLFIFRAKDGTPVHFNREQYKSPIPPGLAVRVDGSTTNIAEVGLLKHFDHSKKQFEIRILDFRIVQ